MATPRGFQRISFLLVTGIIAICGCGGPADRGLPKAAVSGTVSYAQPFPHGEVIFKHVSGEITVAQFGADGAYDIQVPQGNNHVIVRSQTSSLAEQGRPGGQMEVFTNHIPARYGDFATSKLEIVVADGENKFDVALQD